MGGKGPEMKEGEIGTIIFGMVFSVVHLPLFSGEM